MEVTNELVEKLGKLARLPIDPQQKEGLRQDMQQIIGFIKKLNEIDTTGIGPLMHLTSEINRFRAEDVKIPISQEHGVKN